MGATVTKNEVELKLSAGTAIPFTYSAKYIEFGEPLPTHDVQYSERDKK